MTERTGLLHNMSAPPKTVVRYAGLADCANGALAGSDVAGGAGVANTGAHTIGTFGKPVLFALAPDFRDGAPRILLRRLGVKPGVDPAATLEALLDARAAELPLPDGCAVLVPDPSHAAIWHDPLTVLAVLAKCSDTVWLRAKQPMLVAALARRTATLLVPPAFVHQLPEGHP